ncbi:MAG TPA: hypothetical protein VFL41_04715 [Gaiellaceae bacterium]|nr:hypothetical protein [Gaiellaceae bacterium]HET8651415.1 hypothetical protein [Gaiellaceae bacterium]
MTTALAAPGTHVAQALRVGRHLLEMTVAMMLGMFLYGLAVGSILAAAGTTLEAQRLERPEPFALGMAFAMSVPMVAWMRHRGHAWRNSAEMSAAMFVPVVGLIACYRVDAVAAGSICPIACTAMIPAMLVAMLVRLDDYTSHPVGAR